MEWVLPKHRAENERVKNEDAEPGRIFPGRKDSSMQYQELKKLFRGHEQTQPHEHLKAHIIFTEDSFTIAYSEAARTYEISSDNKAFRPNMNGYSIFGSSIDGTDPDVRLEMYMQDERGGVDGWEIENCFLVNE